METTQPAVSGSQVKDRPEGRSVVRDRLDKLAAAATAETDMLTVHLYLDLIKRLDEAVQTSSAFLEILKDAFLQTQHSDVKGYLKEIDSMILFLQEDLKGAWLQ